MKINYIIVLTFLCSFLQLSAQQVKTLTLQEALNLGIENSKSLKVSKSQVTVAEKQLKSTKALQYPDLNVSAQYLHLFDTTDVDLKISNSSGDGSESVNSDSPKPSYMMFGYANLTVPIFSGFKLKNSIKKSEYAVELAKIENNGQKENLLYQILQLYFNLYKTQKSIDVLEENQKRAEQRVKDFKNFLDNGILARNDYLRSTLQVSNVKLSLEEAKTTYRNINYQLNTLLGLPEDLIIQIKNIEEINILPSQDLDISNRNDIRSLEQTNKVDESSIKIAKAGYYPSLSLSGGYIALDLDNIATITNATNVGIGLSYNFASLFKNKSNVDQAKAIRDADLARLDAQKDQAKIEINEALNSYSLSLKKNEVFNEALDQANENYRIVKDKYDNGLSDTDQLLEADVEQLQAQINQAIGFVDSQLALYKYIYTQGNLVETLQLN